MRGRGFRRGLVGIWTSWAVLRFGVDVVFGSSTPGINGVVVRLPGLVLRSIDV